MEEVKKFLLDVLKIIIVIIVIFSTPFIILSIGKILINTHFFENIEELKMMINIFNNKYILMCMGFAFAIILLFFCNWNAIKDFFENMDFNIKTGDKEISARRREAQEKKETSSRIIQENKNSENSAEVNAIVRNKLGLDSENHTVESCITCEKNKETDTIRFFAAYNLLNYEARQMLHVIYNENFIEKDKFKNRILSGYKKRNKKNVKYQRKDLQEMANNKYEMMYEGLKFLGIIETSEDDKEIHLTKLGKDFVVKYIEDGGVEDE